MKPQTREEPKIVAAAERQMRAWVLTAESGQRARRDRPAEPPSRKIGPCITISREAGANGEQIAQLVGQKLGWEVLDRNLLDRVAQRLHVSRNLLETVDETTSHWFSDAFGSWVNPRLVPHAQYVSHLGRIVLNAAKQGNVVIVGRGAPFLLPRHCYLAVRIIASRKYRIEQLRQRHHLTAREARRLMNHLDEGRREFVRHYFHRDLDDLHLYDLVVNVEQLGPDFTADLICTSVKPIAAALARD